jgi:hypothetical protein
MSEEEIIDKLKNHTDYNSYEDYEKVLKLIDLYNKEKEKNNIVQTNYEILQGEMDRIGIDTLGLEKGSSTDDVIEEIKLLLKEKENNREAIQYCKKDLAFKRRLEKAKDTVDNYNAGRFDTSESILNILEE